MAVQSERSTAITELMACHDAILRVDGDRDHMNHSDLSCEQSIAVANACLRVALFLGWKGDAK